MIDTILATRPYRYYPLGDRAGSGATGPNVANLAQSYANAGSRPFPPILGAPSLNASGRTCYEFDGLNDFADTLNSIIGGVAHTDDFTICCWFKTSVAGRAIYCQGNTADHDVLFEFVPNSAGSGMTFQVRNTVSTLTFLVEGAGSPTRADGKVHFAVALRKSARLEIWVDGKRVALSTTWAPPGTYNYNRAVIGRREAIANNYYSGFVQDLATWKRPLAQAEHQAIYLAGRGETRNQRDWIA